MLAPNEISPALAPRKSASVSRASMQQRVGLRAGRIGPVRVGVVVQQVVRHRLGDALRHLRAAGPVEVGHRVRRLPGARAPGTGRGCTSSVRDLRRAQARAWSRGTLRSLSRAASPTIGAAESLDHLHRFHVIGVLAQFAMCAMRNSSAVSCSSGDGTFCSRARSAAMPTSLSSNASRNVRGKARVSDALGKQIHAGVRPAAGRVDDIERHLAPSRPPSPARPVLRPCPRCASRAARC